MVYTRRSDAFAALKRYNNVLLDGKPMKIEIVGANEGMPISARVNVTGVQGRKKRTVVMTYDCPLQTLFLSYFIAIISCIKLMVFIFLHKMNMDITIINYKDTYS